jgi:hypothetical protein
MTPEKEGKLFTLVEGLGTEMLACRTDIKSILAFQAKTEERLAGGVRHFERLDSKMGEFNDALIKKANSKVVYSCVALGFTVLGILITVLKIW